MRRRTLRSDRYFNGWPEQLKPAEQMKLALEMSRIRSRLTYLRIWKIAYCKAQTVLVSQQVEQRIAKFTAEYQRVRNILWETNMRLVCWCARKYSKRATVVDELIGVGAEKMPYWLDHFDPHRGFALSTYLAKCCWMAYVRHLQDERFIDQRVLRLGVPDNNPELWENFIGPVGDDYDQPGYSAEDLSGIGEIVSELPAPEREVLYLRLTTDQTFKQIGRARGISKQRARELERQGLNRIAKAIGEEKAATGIYSVHGRRKSGKAKTGRGKRETVCGNQGRAGDQVSAG